MAKILIIEDKRALSKLYLLLLGQAGHDVRLAHTGEDGVEQATSERPDLIFLDLCLPGISGAEVAQKLWVSTGRGRSSPVHSHNRRLPGSQAFKELQYKPLLRYPE